MPARPVDPPAHEESDRGAYEAPAAEDLSSDAVAASPAANPPGSNPNVC